MELTKVQFGMMITAGADKVIGSADELTAIDAKFGDADHGLTMTKIANAMKKAVADSAPEATIKSLLDDVASAIMVLNGGSAVPLWNTLVDGLAQGAPDSATMDAAQLKAAFKKGYEELYSLSKANVGDKTMMDALAPAIEAICGTDGTIPEMMQAGASAAEKGAEDSKNYVAKFGRARSYKEQTLGTPDAGAMSMKYFFVGLSDGCKDVFNK